MGGPPKLIIDAQDAGVGVIELKEAGSSSSAANATPKLYLELSMRLVLWGASFCERPILVAKSVSPEGPFIQPLGN